MMRHQIALMYQRTEPWVPDGYTGLRIPVAVILDSIQLILRFSSELRMQMQGTDVSQYTTNECELGIINIDV